MADAFLNSVCDLVMISGEPDSAAPFVGVSAQIDVMQEFMEGDMLDSMTGAEDITQAPELWEAQNLSQNDTDKDFDEYINILADDTGRGIEEENDVYGGEQLQQLIAQLQRQQAKNGTGDDYEKGRIEPVTMGLIATLGFGLLEAAANPNVRKFLKSSLKFIGSCPGKIVRLFKGRSRFKTAALNIPKTLKNVTAREQLFGRIADSASLASSTAVMLSQQVGDTMAQVTCMLQMVTQITQMTDVMRIFTPSVAQLYDQFVMLDDTVGQISKLEDNGNTNDKKLPVPEKTEIDGSYYSPEDLMNKILKGQPLPPSIDPNIRHISRATGDRGTETPPPTPSKPTAPSKPAIAIPNVGMYSVADSLRYICRELSILEKEFKVFNSRMVMDKDNIPKFLAGKESQLITQDVGLGEILFRAFNVADKKTAGAVVGPAELKTLSEILDSAFPRIKITDSITKKVQEISVFELIMQAQSAKVIELGPGFLKWYPDLEVLDNRQIVSESPKTGA